MKNKYSVLIVLVSFILFNSVIAQQLANPISKTNLNPKIELPVDNLSPNQLNFVPNNKPVVQNIKKPVITSNYSTHGSNEKCGSSTMHNDKLAKDPVYRQNVDALEQNIKIRKEQSSSTRRAAPYTIPVVFHVMYKNNDAIGTGTNISDAQIISAIAALNRDYQKLSDDGGIAQGAGVASNITFCLAQRDPSNNPHTGINRINVTDATYVSSGISAGGAGMNEVSLKALSKWDNTKYMNVWIVTEIDNSGADNLGSYTGGTLGFAYFPGAGADVDGVVVSHTSLGNDPDGSLGYNLWFASRRNRTMTHEVGHYLSLYHTFEGNACSESCATQGDLCCDTPPTTQGSGCTPGCAGGQPENYMDYTDETCQNMFTADQQTRMYTALDGLRSGLNSSSGCNPVYTLDAGIASVSQPNGTYCGNTVYPVVELKNYGSTTLSSATITYNVNGGTNQVYSWSGSLTNGTSEMVSLSSLTVTAGANIFNVTVSSPNGGSDQFTANDANNSSFSVTSGAGVNLDIFTDAWPWETYWEILNSTSSIVASGGYSGIKPGGQQVNQTTSALGAGSYDFPEQSTTVTESACLSYGCYDLVFYDDYGDGMYGTTPPQYVLKDNAGNVLVTQSAFMNTASSMTDNFCLTQPSVGDDAGISAINTPTDGSTICSTTITPVVSIKNFGSSALTSATINYSVDGGAYQNYSWTGSLASTNSVTVSLPTITVTSGSHTFDVSTTLPNGTTDVDNSNDAATQITFNIATNALTLEIYSDQWPYETYWEVVNTTTSLIEAYGGYAGIKPGGQQVNQNTTALAAGSYLDQSTTITENMCLADGCYDLVFYDDYGDGMYFASNPPPFQFQLFDNASNTLVQEAGFNGISITNSFCVPYTISPPTADFVASATSIPVGSTIVYTDLSTGTPNPYSWSWSVQGGTPGTSIDQNPYVTYTTTGLYSTTLTVDNGTGTDDAIKTDYVNVYYASGGSCDTLYNLTQPEATSVTYYNYGVGYFPGHSNWSNTWMAYAEKYTIASQSVVQKIVLPVFRADAGGAGSFVTFKVWADNGGAPGVELMAEQYLISNLTAQAYNVVDFINKPVVNGTFYVGYELNYGTQDTVIFGMAPNRHPNTTPPTTAYVNVLGTWYDSDTYIQAASNGGAFLKTSLDIETYLSDGYAVPSFTVNTNTICEGDSVFIDASGSYNAADYYWDIDGDMQLDVAGESMWIPYSAGNYDIKLYTVGGCKFDSTSTQNVQVNGITFGGSYADVSCNGMNDGSVTVTPSGDGTSYTYAWSDGQNTSPATGLAPGAYTFTITDNNSCEASGAVTISEPAALSLTMASTSVTSNGGSDGTATANISGGTPTYYYFWDDNQTTATATNLSAGPICVTIYDSYLCSLTDCVTITEPLAPLSITTTSTDETCDALDGSATATVSGGTGTYTYLWSNAQNAATATGLSNGVYTVTVNDGNSSATQNVTVSQTNGTLTASATASDKVCAAPGSATVTPAGGIPAYTYNWSNGATDATVTGLSAITYNVTVTDQNGCLAITSVTVGNNSGTLVASISMTTETCTAGDATATVSATGGTPGYNFLWSDGQTTAVANNLTAGNFAVTVSDQSGCEQYPTITVTRDLGTVTAAENVINQICTTNGSITLTPSNGNGGYSYTWSNAGASNINSNLIAGNYDYTVTDGNGCTYSSSVSVSYDAGNLSGSITATDKVCATLGSASVTPTNGTLPYSYSWSNSATSSSITGLNAGNYSVTATDVNGCAFSTSVTVGNNAGTLAATISMTEENCSAGDGAATVSATNGTPSYTYLWSNAQNGSTANNLTAGGYDVTVSDANGCEVYQSITVTRNNGSITASITATDKVCATPGSATVTPSNGASPYSYNWSNSGTASVNSNLAAGDYFVTITDNNGCMFNTSVTVGNNSGTLNATFSSTDETCGNGAGTATISATGGNTPYTYTWSNAAGNVTSTSGLSAGTYIVTVVDANSCDIILSTTVSNGSGTLAATLSCSGTSGAGSSDGSSSVTATGGDGNYTYTWSANTGGATGTTASGLVSGSYSITVTDGNGCVAVDNCSVTDGIVCNLQSNMFSTAATCGASDGDANIIVTNGTGPFTYIWDDPSNQTAQTAINLPTGSYNVTATDANSCTVTGSVNVGVAGGPSATFTTSGDCGSGNGTALANTTGGVSPYTYNWNNGQNSATATGLTAGNTYTVTITDNTGCTGIASTSISAGSLSLTFDNTASCGTGNTGSSTVNVVGGSGSYTYQWSNSAMTQSVNNLAVGTYTVTVDDGNGCVNSGTANIVQGTAINVATMMTAQTCGVANGTATVSNISGGNSPYTYNWSDPFGQTSATAINLVSGQYVVTVTDASGCKGTKDVIVFNTGNLNVASIATTPEFCNGDCTGSAILSGVSGGSPGYTYVWSDPSNQTDVKAFNLCSGTYTVTVSDAAGCKFIARTTITAPSNITLTETVTQPKCSQENGYIYIGAFGGTTTNGYTYQWSNGNITSSMSGLTTGNFTITVYDSRNCSATTSVALNNYGDIDGSLDVYSADICTGESVTVTASGGSSYMWNTGQTTTSLVANSTGSYICTIGNGTCTDKDTVDITVYGIPVVNAAYDVNGGCPGHAVKLTASGALHYEWSNGDTTAVTYVYPNSSTVYTVTGYDLEVCGSTTANLTITPDPAGTSAIATADATAVVAGTTVNFDGSQSNADTYEWDFNEDGTTDATGATASHTFTQNGIYDVVLTTSLSGSACIGTDTIRINVGNVGIDEVDASAMFGIYPNPTSGEFVISVNADLDNKISVTIYNNIGELVLMKDNIMGNTTFNLSKQPTGVYLVKISSDKYTTTKKISLVR